MSPDISAYDRRHVHFHKSPGIISRLRQFAVTLVIAAIAFTMIPPSTMAAAPPTFTITYDRNEATSGTVPTPQQGAEHDEILIATNPGSLTRDGFTFAGWNTKANGTGYLVCGEFQMPPHDLTLYALWTSADPFLDRDSQPGGNRCIKDAANLWATQTVAQPFVSGATGILERVSLGLARQVGWGAPFRSFTVAIHATADDKPTGLALAEKTLSGTDLTDLPLYGEGLKTVTVTFASPPAVVSGTTYAIVVSVDGGNQLTNDWLVWFVGNYSKYSLYGDTTRPGTTLWKSDFPFPLVFSTYVDRSRPSPAPPQVPEGTPAEQNSSGGSGGGESQSTSDSNAGGSTNTGSATSHAPGPLPVTEPIAVGDGLVMVNGVVSKVGVSVVAGRSWKVRGDGFTMEFVPEQLEGGLAGSFSARAGGWIDISGDGYQPGTLVATYLPGFLTATLGEARVAGDGTFSVRAQIPVTLTPGQYVLQVNGLASPTSVRSVNMGLNVLEAGVGSSRAKAVSKRALFKPGSAALTPKARAEIARFVSANMDTASSAVVVPRVALGASPQEFSLAQRRAVAVVKALQASGLSVPVRSTKVRTATSISGAIRVTAWIRH